MFPKRIAIAFTIFALLTSGVAKAANTALSGLSAASSIGGSNLFYVVQTVGSGGVAATASQLAVYFEGLISGDCSINTSTNVITCTKTNGTAFGALATATPGTGVATAIGNALNGSGGLVGFSGALGTPTSGTLTNATGLPISTGVSGLGTSVAAFLASPTSANFAAAVTGETGSGAVVFGTAPTISSLNATTAATLAYITGSTQCLHVSTTGAITGTGSDCGSGSSTITAGTTPTSGFTSGNLIATAGAVTTDSGIATSAVTTLTGTQTLTNKTLTSPTLTTPALGTPASGTLTNTTGFPLANLSGAGTGVLTAAANATNGAGGLATYVLGSSSAFGLVKVDGTTITATAGVISATTSGGTVTSVAAGCGTTTGGSPITATGTVSAAITRRANTATTDTIVSTDCGNVVSESNASPVAATIAQAGTTGFGAGSYFWICNINAGAVTLTPTTSTIGGASTLVVNAGSAAHPNCTGFQSDGTNYNLVDRVPGSGVAIASANALSSAGGLTSTIASGTATIPATAIASGACGTAITVTATNVATTDVVTAGFAADPTATTGFLPTAMLTIVPYPTSGNANFKVCNLTLSSITPTSTTINWRVVR